MMSSAFCFVLGAGKSAMLWLKSIIKPRVWVFRGLSSSLSQEFEDFMA